MSYTQNNPLSRKNSPLNSFDSLVTELEGQGKSHEAATKIAGSVANAKMHGAGSGPTAKQKARHGVSRQPGKPVEENRMTKGDQMPSRKSSSPLNNTGMTGLNYSKELQYMPIEDDMHRGMSRKTNTWEEEDVKEGRKLESEGHYGHAEADFDDAHDSYNWRPGMDTHAEHGTSRRSSSPLNDHHGFKQFPTSVHKKPADPLEGVPYPERDWEGESDYMEQRDSIKPMKMKLEKNIKRIEKPVKRMMMSKKLTKIDKPRSGGPR